ncbi:MAG: hypothetical protein EOO54_17620, partial [Haliea sp.]
MSGTESQAHAGGQAVARLVQQPFMHPRAQCGIHGRHDMVDAWSIYKPAAFLRAAPLLVLAAFLTACGGGGGGGEPPPTPAPPAITSQPISQTVQAGQSATFSVAAVGDGPLSYQWQRAGADVPGATSTSYTLANAQLDSNASVWTARVTNPAGSVLSTSATLSVLSAPVEGTVTLLAGDLTQSGALDGAGAAARFNQPQGLAVDASGKVLVADSLNHT